MGNVPSAVSTAQERLLQLRAFETYVDGIKRWVAVAREGREPVPDDRCPPIGVPATREWAEALDGRLLMLNESIKPYFQ